MTRNPVPDLEALSDTVDSTNLGNATVFVSNRKTYRAYQASTPWIVGTANDPAVNPLPYEISNKLHRQRRQTIPWR